MPTVRPLSSVLVLIVSPLLVWALTGRALADAPWPNLANPSARSTMSKHDVVLLVSIESYARLPPVSGATGNAVAWRRWFHATRGVPDHRIAWLSDTHATSGEILAKAEALRALADPRGRIWVVFMGHGAPAANGKEGALVGWDARTVPLSLLVAALGDGHQAPITLVIDASFNGRGRSGEDVMDGPPRVPPKDPASLLPANVSVLMAARGDEFARPLPGTRTTAFSYLVLGALRGWADDRAYGDGDKQVTVGEVLTFTRAALAATIVWRNQTPEAAGPLGEVLVRGAKEAAPDLAAIHETERQATPPEGFVRVEPGTFTMGSPVGEEGRAGDEAEHEVHVTRPFLLKAREVTRGEWRDLMGDRRALEREPPPCDDTCPVDMVSWNDAVAYVNTLSQREGLPVCYRRDGEFVGLDCPGYRLPTEAEWEYAARAGTTDATYAPREQAAWFRDNSGQSPHAVSRQAPNAWAFYDMLGNDWEWTQDWLAPYGGPARDPAGPTSGTGRVLRGGSWHSGARDVRAARRKGLNPEFSHDDVTFRPARTISR